jgi:protein translocase SecG subunit
MTLFQIAYLIVCVLFVVTILMLSKKTGAETFGTTSDTGQQIVYARRGAEALIYKSAFVLSGILILGGIWAMLGGITGVQSLVS